NTRRAVSSFPCIAGTAPSSQDVANTRRLAIESLDDQQSIASVGANRLNGKPAVSTRGIQNTQSSKRKRGGFASHACAKRKFNLRDHEEFRSCRSSRRACATYKASEPA